MEWETRVHWWWGLFLPARGALLLAALAALALLTFTWWGAALGLAALPFAAFGLLDRWARWRAFALSFSPADRTIRERHGLVMVVERRVNLELAGSVTFRQDLAGRLLDCGWLSIGAMGGPYEWGRLAGFRTLRRIVESRGGWSPPPPADPLGDLAGWLRAGARVARRLWAAALRARPRVARRARPSYARFVRFAGEVLFARAARRFEQAAAFPGDREAPISTRERELYARVLRERRVLVRGADGRLGRHARVRSLDDLRRLVPPEWFAAATRG